MQTSSMGSIEGAKSRQSPTSQYYMQLKSPYTTSQVQPAQNQAQIGQGGSQFYTIQQ